MNTTFTIQTVHGLKDTFVVSPNGKVDTTRLGLTEKPAQETRADEPRDKRDA